jgi:tetratricopeptide (TPR) repeat protein
MCFRCSQQCPLVIAVEDLHWIDTTSEEYFASLVENIAGARMLLVFTYRSGYHPPWIGKSYVTQIALQPLTPQESQSIVRSVLGTDEVADSLVALILSKAEGNPFFLEELARAAREQGGPSRTIAVPETIEEVLLARINRLPPEEKQLLQATSVIGKDVPFALLRAVADLSDDELRHGLTALQAAEFLYETRVFPEPACAFKHAVLQDVAYQTLPFQRRQGLHGAIGRALEELYADRLDEQAAVLAYHYAQSGRQDRALEYALLAGDRSARLYANAEASTYYTQALTMARALPASSQAQRLQIDASIKLATVGVTRQDIERDLANLERARTLAEELRDAPRLARVLYWLGRLHYVLYNPQLGITYATQSLEIAEHLGDDSLAALPVNLLGRAYWQTSDFVKASQMLVRSAELMRRLGNKSEESTAAGFAGNVLGLMGQFDRSLSHLDRGIQLAQEIQDPFAEAAAYMYRGIIQDQRGEWALAIADYRSARQAAERAGDMFRLYLVRVWDGRAHTMAGDPTRGKLLLEESLALAGKIGTKFGLAWLKTFLAASHRALGELDDARGDCEEETRLAKEGGDKWTEAIARQTLADTLCRLTPSDLDQADQAIRLSIELKTKIAARPELARSYLSYARVLKAKGEVEKANDQLARAIGMFEQMGMAWDLANADRALRDW